THIGRWTSTFRSTTRGGPSRAANLPCSAQPCRGQWDLQQCHRLQDLSPLPRPANSASAIMPGHFRPGSGRRKSPNHASRAIDPAAQYPPVFRQLRGETEEAQDRPFHIGPRLLHCRIAAKTVGYGSSRHLPEITAIAEEVMCLGIVHAEKLHRVAEPVTL